MGNDYGGKRCALYLANSSSRNRLQVIIVQTSGGFIKTNAVCSSDGFSMKAFILLKAIAKKILCFSTAGPIGFGKDVDYLSD